MKPQISTIKLVLIALIFSVTGLINAQKKSEQGPSDEVLVPKTECEYQFRVRDNPPISRPFGNSATSKSEVSTANNCEFDLTRIHWYYNSYLYNEIIKSKTENCFFRKDLDYSWYVRDFYDAYNMQYIAYRLKNDISNWRSSQSLKHLLSSVYFLRAATYINYYDPDSFFNDGVESSDETKLTTNLSSLIYKSIADNYSEFLNWDFDPNTTLKEPSRDLLTFLSEIVILTKGGFAKKHLNLTNYQLVYIAETLSKIANKLSNIPNILDSPNSYMASRLLLEIQRWHYVYKSRIVLAESHIDDTINLFSSLRDIVDNNIADVAINPRAKKNYLILNSITEMGRYLSDSSGKFYIHARDKLLTLIQTYDSDNHSLIYGRTASAITAHSDLDLGDWEDKIQRAYYNRSRTFNIYNNQVQIKLFGNVSYAKLDMVKAEMLKTWVIFQDIFGDENQLSVANGDNTTRLNVWVHENVSDYELLAGYLFGIRTDNGGLYLEGNPSNNGNTANLFMFGLKERTDGPWESWNAGHEFWHFLDGKFIKAGPYHKDVSIAWTEGTADMVQKALIYSSQNDRKHRFQKSVNSIRHNYKTPTQIIDISEASYNNWVNEDIYYNPSVLWTFFFDKEKLKLRSIGETLKALTPLQLKTQSTSVLKAKVEPYKKYFRYWVRGTHLTTTSPGYTGIRPNSSYRYFDVYGNSRNDETQIITYPYNGNNNQKFYLEPVSSDNDYDLEQYNLFFENTFHIKSKMSNKYLKINASDSNKYLRQGPGNDNEKTFKIIPMNNNYHMITINPDGNRQYALSESVKNYFNNYSGIDVLDQDFTSRKQTLYINNISTFTGPRSTTNFARNGNSEGSSLSTTAFTQGIDDENSFSIFPNPTLGKILHFRYPKDFGNLKVNIYTITGVKTNESKIITDDSGKGTLKTNLATGVYIIKFENLNDRNKTVTKKLVVL